MLQPPAVNKIYNKEIPTFSSTAETQQLHEEEKNLHMMLLKVWDKVVKKSPCVGRTWHRASEPCLAKIIRGTGKKTKLQGVLGEYSWNGHTLCS